MKVLFISLGCDKNLVDSEFMLGKLTHHKFTVTDDEQEADIIVINTCCFIHDAKEESIQSILDMAQYRTGGNCKALIVCGCLAERYRDEILKEIPEVDAVLGTNSTEQICDAIEKVLLGDKYEAYEPLTGIETHEAKRSVSTGGHYAHLKIAEGCSKHCTYCIIPFARGRVRSRKIADVLREVETLASKGYKEVVLTGIHLSSYGVDFPKEERESLLSLIQAVSKVAGIQRIRLGSLEPRIITEEFLEGIVATGKVCPHFHLSLQSGCNKTLKNMNRRYSAQEYAEKCDLIRRYYPAPALTTDVIVGFPMETEEDFEASYEFVKNIHFYETHIFKYSRRHGTKAAAMDGQLTEAVKVQRSEKFLALHDIRAKEYEEAMIGKTIELLLEEEIEEDGKMWYVGHSREYVRAVIEKTEAHQVNDLVEAKVTGFVTDHLLRAE